MEIIRYHDQNIRRMAEGLHVPVLLLGKQAQFGSRELSRTHLELFQRAHDLRRLAQAGMMGTEGGRRVREWLQMPPGDKGEPFIAAPTKEDSHEHWDF